jgi:hypothetical protein
VAGGLLLSHPRLWAVVLMVKEAPTLVSLCAGLEQHPSSVLAALGRVGISRGRPHPLPPLISPSLCPPVWWADFSSLSLYASVSFISASLPSLLFFSCHHHSFSTSLSWRNAETPGTLVWLPLQRKAQEWKGCCWCGWMLPARVLPAFTCKACPPSGTLVAPSQSPGAPTTQSLPWIWNIDGYCETISSVCDLTLFCFALFLVALKIELRALHLLGKSLKPQLPPFFAFSCFLGRVSCFLPMLALDCDPPTYTSCVVGTTNVNH